MESFGSRLKEERERIGLSQAKFAEACGVGKTAQFNYESNARMPDGDYLYRAGKQGVDTGYLLFSERSSPNSLYCLAAANVLPFIAKKVGLSIGALMWILDRAAEMEAQHWGGTGLDIEQEDILALIDDLFNAGDLLEAVIVAVSESLQKFGVSLSINKRFSLTMMLFRAFKSTGKIDSAVIDDAVRLAGA
jgi:transcriptional regulator with XRE-family HTH domain